MNYPNIYLKKEGWGKEQVQKNKERKTAAGAEYISKKQGRATLDHLANVGLQFLLNNS